MASYDNCGAHMEPLDLSGLEDRGEEEEIIVSFNGNAADTRFDTIVGHIEEIVMSDKFQTVQNEFLDKHYKIFENNDENKLEYTDIHKDYTQLVEKVLEDELSKYVAGFNMEEFQEDLVSRKDELDGEIFDILLTFSDFVTFKEMVLDYKAMKEGNNFDLSHGIRITPLVSSSQFSHPHGIGGITSIGSGDQQSNSSSNPLSHSEQMRSNALSLSGDLDLLVIGTSMTPRKDSNH